MDRPVIEINNLKTYFDTDRGTVKGVDGVTFSIKHGETLALVGESGSGKSMTALSIMNLIPKPPGKIVDGEILFKEQDIVHLKDKEMNKMRGNNISMIFQEPMTSLNPVYTIGNQLMETLLLHQKISKKKARKKSIELLKLVGFGMANKVIDQYPHQLSGGMRQRVMIAIAMANKPELLIADEPTTALDVTIQAEILDLMIELREKTNTAILLITHDLGVVAEMADRVMVMYAGQIVEETDVKTLFNNPQHPYTKGLLESMPDIESEKERLSSIKGTVPNAYEFPRGCRFAPRCPYRTDACSEKQELISISEDHSIRCVVAAKEYVE